MPEPITNMTTAPGSVCTSSTSVPYIGVGLEVYCAVEPCLMCAMALVHSRIARVVYRLPLQVSHYLNQNEATPTDPDCMVSLFHHSLP
jgi:tRNA(Arg) A34 adenosine deaminase TadA